MKDRQDKTRIKKIYYRQRRKSHYIITYAIVQGSINICLIFFSENISKYTCQSIDYFKQEEHTKDILINEYY
jgi:hypothetical protein